MMYRYALIGFTLFFSLCFSGLGNAEFRNQYAVFGDAKVGHQNLVNFGLRMGYEWIVGEPYDANKAVLATDAGLKVLFNINGDFGAKWVRFNIPGGTIGNPTEPTKVNWGIGNRDITNADRTLLESALCMTAVGAGMDFDQLYDEPSGTWKYVTYGGAASSSTVVFRPNFRTQAGVNAAIQGTIINLNNQENSAGKMIYHGLFVDEITFCEAATGCTATVDPNPGCANAPSPDFTFNEGRRRYIKGVKNSLIASRGAAWGGISGNPFRIDNMSPEYNEDDFQFDLLYSESSGGVEAGGCKNISVLRGNHPNGCGTQDATTWGVVPKNRASVQLSPPNTTTTPTYYEASWEGALLIEGRAAPHDAWGGWYGQNSLKNGTRGTMLMRAVPNWDNIRGATSKTWNESTDTYTSSNSFMSLSIAYSRHREYATNHKMFMVKNSGTPSITLAANERVVNAKCTSNDLNTPWLETTDCVSGYFTQASNVVSLGANIVTGAGYVLIVHRQPSLQSATVPVADQLNVCFNRDDSLSMLPATNSTGWAVTVDGVSKTSEILTTNRITPNCFRLTFTASTITTSSQVVRVSYTSGNITSGTDQIGAANEVPAANFGLTIANNTIAGGGGGTPVLAQTKYQWQNNVGGAATAALYGSLGSQIQPSPGGQARLIIKIRNTVNTHVPTQIPLYFAVDPVDPTDPDNGIPLTDSCATNQACFTHALGLDTLIPGVELLASDETTNVACGVIESENAIPTVTFETDSETECIYAIRFKENLNPGQTVYFYPRRDSGLLSSYTNSNLPHVTIQAPRSDQINGSTIGGTFR